MSFTALAYDLMRFSEVLNSDKTTHRTVEIYLNSQDYCTIVEYMYNQNRASEACDQARNASSIKYTVGNITYDFINKGTK